MRRCRTSRLAAALLIMAAGLAGAPPASGADSYRPPVDGEPVDLFRPPSTPFGPGNRGLEYRPPFDAEVRAAADGTVVFAGQVAGARHVTVRHADGLRTSYSFLASIAVAQGQVVVQGQRIGASSGVLHFGVRSGDTYVDPLALFGTGPPRVRLVPEPAPGGSPTEAAALVPVVLDALRPERGSVARHYLLETDLGVRVARIAVQGVERWRSDERCTEPSTPPPSPPDGPRIAVLVGGFGSTSASASVDDVDVVGLGYDDRDVVRFSYGGGRTPGRPPDGALAGLPASSYDRSNSQSDLLDAAERLRLLLAEVAAARPGVPIDVIAHSQGGVVAQIALTDLSGGPAVPPAVDLVATLGSPHEGTDLATAIAAVHDAPSGPEGLASLEQHLETGLDPGAPAVAQLSEVSPLMAELRAAPPPEGVRLLGVGARGDLTVPAGHTRLWEGAHRVIDLAGPDAHSDLPGAPATTRELALALAGEPPTCEEAVEALANLAVPEGISWAQDRVGAAAWALAWTLPD